jgi:hypothetical protein
MWSKNEVVKSGVGRFWSMIKGISLLSMRGRERSPAGAPDQDGSAKRIIVAKTEENRKVKQAL